MSVKTFDCSGDTHKTDACLSFLSSGDEVHRQPPGNGLMTSVLVEMMSAPTGHVESKDTSLAHR
jgi:hypothetical protein